MTYKIILVHCEASESVSHRLGVAAELAQRFDAHLLGLHVREPFETSAFFDGGLVMDDLFRMYDEAASTEEAAAAAAFEKAIKGKNLSPEWRVVTGYPKTEVAAQARYADLAVLGQDEPEAAALTSGLPETVALTTGRPILVVPYIGAKQPPGKVVLLCWNASREAARAAADAMPLLKAAEKVIVLTVNPEASVEGPAAEPGVDAAAWLGRHGVNASVHRDVAPDSDVGGIILSRAADHGANLIVMGLYGHSRMREMVLGGASRTLLSSMTVPVFMAH
jgi:nucleotide-binding universal stress UspA family protein